MTFSWCKFGFGKCFGTSSQSNHWAGHCWLSYKTHFSSHITIWSRNGLLLCRIRETLQNDNLFLFSLSSWGTHLMSFFTFPICFKCRTTVEWSILSSAATSHIVVRGPISMMLWIGCCYFWWPATMLLIFKGLVSFAELLEPPLHCMFVSSSWAKCIVDVVRCLCCFTPHLNSNKNIT